MDIPATPAGMPELDFDPFSRAFLENPFPDHARLRDAGPVAWLQHYGVYAVGRHAEVRAVLQDWGTFSSAAGVGLADFRREKPWRLPSLVLETDPPMHGRARRVLSRVLSARAIQALRERFQHDADEMVAELIARRSFDAVADLAEAYPLRVFPDAVGMPRENRRYLLPYGNMVFNSFGPRNAFFEDAVRDAAPVFEWVQAQSQRSNLSATGFGAEIHAAADAGELTAEEAPMVVRSLLTAGVDTTVSGLGAALLCLATHPEQFPGAAGEPGLGKGGVRGGSSVRESGADLLSDHDAARGAWRRHAGRGTQGARVHGRGQPRPAALGAAGRLRH